MELWREVLGIADIGVSDSFFDLGGHSLLATKLASRAKDQFQIDFPLRAMFEMTTVADMAVYINTLLKAKNDAGDSDYDDEEMEDIEI